MGSPRWDAMLGALLWPRRPLQDLFIKLPLPEHDCNETNPVARYNQATGVTATPRSTSGSQRHHLSGPRVRHRLDGRVSATPVDGSGAQLNDRGDALSEAMERKRSPATGPGRPRRPGMDTRFAVGCRDTDHRRRRACSWGEQ